MKNTRPSHPAGFTMVELLVAMQMAAIFLLAVGVVAFTSHKAYRTTCEKANADVVTEAFAARRLFDAAVRKAYAADLTVANDGESVRMSYYSDDATYLDRYVRFYVSDSDLLAEYGTIGTRGRATTDDTITVCTNVSSCIFRATGVGVSMVLSLDDGERTNVVVTSAYAHN